MSRRLCWGPKELFSGALVIGSVCGRRPPSVNEAGQGEPCACLYSMNCTPAVGSSTKGRNSVSNVKKLLFVAVDIAEMTGMGESSHVHRKPAH